MKRFPGKQTGNAFTGRHLCVYLCSDPIHFVPVSACEIFGRKQKLLCQRLTIFRRTNLRRCPLTSTWIHFDSFKRMRFMLKILLLLATRWQRQESDSNFSSNGGKGVAAVALKFFINSLDRRSIPLPAPSANPIFGDNFTLSRGHIMVYPEALQTTKLCYLLLWAMNGNAEPTIPNIHRLQQVVRALAWKILVSPSERMPRDGENP